MRDFAKNRATAQGKKKTSPFAYALVLTLGAGIFLTLGSLSEGIQLLSTKFGPWEGSWQIAGGWLGYFLEQQLSKILGPIGAALFSVVMFFAGVQLLFKISWRRLLKVVSAAVASDYRDWTSARRELNSRLKNISEKQPAEGPVYDVKPIPEPPPGIKTKPGADAAPEFVPPKTQIVRPSKAQENTARKAAVPLSAGAAADKEAPHNPPELHFKDFKLPTPDLLDPVAEQGFVGPSDEEMAGAKKKLEETLKSFNISAYVADIYPGPVITRYEVTPAPGVKISSIVSLSNDLALAMKAAGIRVIAPIPGKSAIGFEIPNLKRAKVCLREVLESSDFNDRKEPLLFAIGRHAEGSMAMADLEGMPHLLVAGSTGSGKSVFLQSLIVSLMYRRTPDELKFVFIDPKRLELSSYQDIPYLYDPKETPDRVAVITDAKDAAKTLIALTKVMMKRYKKFERARVKNIAGYNKWAKANNEPQEYYIVVVIDELADLMVQAKNVVEEGKCDLLYLTKDSPKPLRIQGAYVSEAEINTVVEYLKTQGKPHYTPL
ncbi:MAG: DNA translocase FtsK 4TM domain-containing protein [Elusimicrobia bacterium]|nr:DNA translocase FtsK 4TM domain-containing protein [Elusimicrobiota bacterium]